MKTTTHNEQIEADTIEASREHMHKVWESMKDSPLFKNMRDGLDFDPWSMGNWIYNLSDHVDMNAVMNHCRKELQGSPVADMTMVTLQFVCHGTNDWFANDHQKLIDLFSADDRKPVAVMILGTCRARMMDFTVPPQFEDDVNVWAWISGPHPYDSPDDWHLLNHWTNAERK